MGPRRSPDARRLRRPCAAPLLEEVYIDTLVESCQRAADGITADLAGSRKLTSDWSDLRLLSVHFAEQQVGSAEVLYVSKPSIGVDSEHVNYDGLRLRVTIYSIGGVQDVAVPNLLGTALSTADGQAH